MHRVVLISPTDTISISVTDTETTSGSATVTVTPEPPPTTSVGYPVTHSCTFQIGPTGDKGVIHAEVLRDGKVVTDGMGDNVADALLALIEYMLPPEDPEYPRQPAP